MTARRVHAVLAAGVNHPELIARWRKEPQRLANLGIEPESLDLATLWKFVGLTVKVRHNGVRQLLPLTFRLLGQSGLEIEFFASLAVYMAQNELPYASGAMDRARDLGLFLEQWLETGVKEHILLWDVFRHELALARLGRPVPTTAAPRGIPRSATAAVAGALTGGSVLSRPGEAFFHEMQCDPRSLGTVLFRKASTLDPVVLETHYFCYWRPAPEQGIQILELDAFGYHVLSRVDGVRTAGEISRELGGSRRPSRGFLRSLGQLAGVGVLQAAPRRCASRK